MLALLLCFVTSGFLVEASGKNLCSTISHVNVKVDSVYQWVCKMQQSNGLLLSSEGGKYVSLYDNAIAILVFTAFGDFDKAEKALEFFNDRMATELMVSPGGFGQLRTADGIPVENRPRRWLGDNAWLLIAINNYHYYAKNSKYEELAKALSNWIVSLQDSDGGLWGGFNADGSGISKITEGNIDAFNAVVGNEIFHEKLHLYLKNFRWDYKDKMLIAWPEYPEFKYALDLVSWGYCVFEDFPTQFLCGANRFKTSQVSAISQKPVCGYCFDEDKDVVWFEGTGQMVVAFNKAQKRSKSKMYLKEMKKSLVESSLFPGTYALPYTSNSGSSYGKDNLWNGVDRNPAVSSTVWYLFGLLRFDPFKLGRDKNIPVKDKFWIK